MKKTKPTLLEQIVAVPMSPRGRPRSKVIDADTAIAWIKGEIKLSQISKILWPDRPASSTATMCYLFLNMSLREAYDKGKLKIVE